MIKPSTWYIVACDVCGEELDDDEGGSYLPYPARALEYARDLNCWWIGNGENPAVICESRDADHIDKAREAIATLTECDDRDKFFDFFPEIDPHDFPPLPAAAMPGQTVIPIGA